MANLLNRLGRAFTETHAGKALMPGPLEMFQEQQRGKLMRFLQNTPVSGADNAPGLMDGFFGGRNIEFNSNGEIGLSEASDRLAKIRTRGAIAVGSLMAANTLGVNPMGLTSGLNNLAMLGVHATIGSTLYRAGGVGKVAGLAYMGAAAINTFRGGDNAGPM